MSGHSKWSQIKRQKGVVDVKRGQTFTKMANAITIAVREGGGGDPASNFKLRLAIEQARSVNMPKENKNRTTSEIKGVIEHSGGTFVSPGAVSWMFSEEGLITVPKNGKSMDEFLDLAIEAGAEDVVEGGDVVEIYTKPQTLESIKKVLIEKGLNPSSVEISKKPSTTVLLNNAETAKKILDLMEKLEALDDVAKVWSNFDMPDELLSKS